MKIGVYSGTFDPLTNGHLWVINEGSEIFDELHVVVGWHPAKKHLFTNEQRVEMTQECVPEGRNIFVSQLGEGNILDWIEQQQFDSSDTVTLMRGIRNDNDLSYESNIANAVYNMADNVHQTFIIPPEGLTDVSSSFVKKRCEVGNWEVVARCVPWPVMKRLQAHYIDKKSNWLVTSPEVASIFETTTAGFAPAPCETGKINKSRLNKSGSCRSMTWKETTGQKQHFIGMFDPIIYDAAERGRDFFVSLVKNGFINFSEEVSGDQVRNMLDPFPVDVVVSETFRLKSIPIDSIRPLGKRHLPRSQSFGPIIVEANEVIGDNTELGVLGPNIIIEGKHRWLDAKDAGQKTMLAWVGERSQLWNNEK